jgi:hypothetical protein
MHPPLRDGEVDAVKSDNLAKGLADPARANRKALGRPGRCLPGRRAVMLFGCCPEARQYVSELGM